MSCDPEQQANVRQRICSENPEDGGEERKHDIMVYGRVDRWGASSANRLQLRRGLRYNSADYLSRKSSELARQTGQQ